MGGRGAWSRATKGGQPRATKGTEGAFRGEEGPKPRGGVSTMPPGAARGPVSLPRALAREHADPPPHPPCSLPTAQHRPPGPAARAVRREGGRGDAGRLRHGRGRALRQPRRELQLCGSGHSERLQEVSTLGQRPAGHPGRRRERGHPRPAPDAGRPGGGALPLAGAPSVWRVGTF